MPQKGHTTFTTLLFLMVKKPMTLKVNKQRQIVPIQLLECKKWNEG